MAVQRKAAGKTAEKKAAAPAVKAEAPKAAAPAAPAAEAEAPKAAEEKAPAEKKETAKKAAPKKEAVKKTPTAKNEEPEAKVVIEFAGKSVVAKDILDAATKAYAESHKGTAIKNIDIYVKPEESVAYYVVNGEGSDDFKIEL